MENKQLFEPNVSQQASLNTNHFLPPHNILQHFWKSGSCLCFTVEQGTREQRALGPGELLKKILQGVKRTVSHSKVATWNFMNARCSSNLSRFFCITKSVRKIMSLKNYRFLPFLIDTCALPEGDIFSRGARCREEKTFGTLEVSWTQLKGAISCQIVRSSNRDCSNYFLHCYST